MSRTFEVKIPRDNTKPISKQVQEESAVLREKGMTPQGYKYDDNFITFGGNY